MEDIDTLNGADIYNGQDSTLWRNVRDAFYPELSAMYNKLRTEHSDEFSYVAVEKRFEDHQDKWSENIFNEDALFKYIQPLYDEGTTAYLKMLQGSKSEQRKFWLYNRFKYLDSKYVAGDAASDVITLRGYAKADIGVTPFLPIYCVIKYGSSLVQERGQQNIETILECPLDLVNDTETYIYSASQIKAISDLTNYKVGYADFSKATRLQSLIIHNDMNNPNGNLKFLSLGNNKLLQTLICRNTPNLTQSINLVGCTGIQSAYFEKTGITGVQLSNGATIRTLVLPNTITNLTLRNTLNLETLTIGDNTDYSNISTLWIENVDSICANKTKLLSFLNDMADGSRIRIIGLNIDLDHRSDINDLYEIFDRFTGLDANGNNVDKAQISGTISVNVISDDRIAEYKKLYPYINIERRSRGFKVTYKNGNETIFIDEVDRGENSEYMGETPVKQPVDFDGYQTRYNFVGWASSDGQTSPTSGILNNITINKSVYAAYTPINYYEVHFMNHDGTIELYTDHVKSGGTAVYGGTMDIKESAIPNIYWKLRGWSNVKNDWKKMTNSTLTNVTAERTVYASMIQAVEEFPDVPEALVPNPADSSRIVSANIYNPANVFDGNLGSAANTGLHTGTWGINLGYHFKNKACIRSVFCKNSGGDAHFTSATIKVSNDGTNWESISNTTALPHDGSINFNSYEDNGHELYEYAIVYMPSVHYRGVDGRGYFGELQFYGNYINL